MSIRLNSPVMWTTTTVCSLQKTDAIIWPIVLSYCSFPGCPSVLLSVIEFDSPYCLSRYLPTTVTLISNHEIQPSHRGAKRHTTVQYFELVLSFQCLFCHRPEPLIAPHGRAIVQWMAIATRASFAIDLLLNCRKSGHVSSRLLIATTNGTPLFFVGAL